MNVYFKNIRVINPIQKLDQTLNLWLKDGLITHCSQDDANYNGNTEVINGEKLVCAPGFFDMHVHLREPGYEYKEDIQSGTEAAANGGFTGVCCMPNTSPAIDDITVIEFIKQKAKGKLVDVEIAGAITQNREGKNISPMLEMTEYGVKIFTDDGSCVSNSEMMKRAFDYAATKDLLISQHCEDITLTKNFDMNDGPIANKLGLNGYPSVAEEFIIARDIMLSEFCGNRRYHVSHISTKGAVRIIRDAKKRGLRITCETTPHHFTLTDNFLYNYDTNYKMNPPLRTNEDVEAIKIGLTDGTIDCIVTDHAPHALHEKETEFDKAPYGIIGLETAVGIALHYLYHSKILTLQQLVEKMSINPRKIINLNEITIKQGEKANLSIFAPEEEWIIDKDLFKSKSRNTPYHGLKIKGKQKFAINNNQIVKCII